jgi:hypothetical protein
MRGLHVGQPAEGRPVTPEAVRPLPDGGDAPTAGEFRVADTDDQPALLRRIILARIPVYLGKYEQVALETASCVD